MSLTQNFIQCSECSSILTFDEYLCTHRKRFIKARKKGNIIRVKCRRCFRKKHPTIYSRYKRMEYPEYLKTSHWRILSKKCKKRDGYKCRNCKTTNHLNAHHIFYRLRGMECLRDLITLCEKCHLLEHKNKSKYRDLILRTLLWSKNLKYF